MRRLTEEECMMRLMPAKFGDHIRVRYVPGRPPSARAIEEAQIAVDRGLDLHVFMGSFEDIGLNRKGRFFFTLRVLDRNSTVDGEEVRGAYRAFNPSLGEVRALRVIR